MFEVREEVEPVGDDRVAPLPVEIHDDPDAAVRALLGRIGQPRGRRLLSRGVCVNHLHPSLPVVYKRLTLKD
ncbi:hypothetical protein GCM10008985_19700 [Halococcus dombrowskii]|uniref:Uncharacterized protein n=1 Tax=Halococcus dombrowskii TaxID=179637 RepID=A0AAV3SH31_HALDO